jgi:hypothetical protein
VISRSWCSGSAAQHPRAERYCEVSSPSRKFSEDASGVWLKSNSRIARELSKTILKGKGIGMSRVRA